MNILTRDIEKYGSGFIRIRKKIAKYPTMKLDYKEIGDGFLVKVSYEQQKTTSVLSITEGVTGGVTGFLECIRKEQGKRIPQYASALGIPKKTLERWILILREKGLIEYRGSSRTGGYFAK